MELDIIDEPLKPFACGITDCGMSFTNEDHLHVHRKKHDMVLQLGIEQKSAFAVDQTPTPTRFIRNCEEVGLFQELQNVNPFDEGFKKAMENRSCILPLEAPITPNSSDDVLHTPQMVFPIVTETTDSALYTNTNNKNITINRTSSEETSIIKEYETTISKCRNEVTISQTVGKPDVLDKVTTTDDVSIVRFEEYNQNKDIVSETVSFTNNIIKVHNVEARKEDVEKTPTIISYGNVVSVVKSLINTGCNKPSAPSKDCEKVPPIMTQKSLDLFVDTCLASDPDICPAEKTRDEQLIKALKNNFNNNFHKKCAPKVITSINSAKAKPLNFIKRRKKSDDIDKIEENYEVLIKLPTGQYVRMKAVNEDKQTELSTKEVLKKVIEEKKVKQNTIPLIQNVNVLPSGTLIPVTVVNGLTGPIIVETVTQNQPPSLVKTNQNAFEVTKTITVTDKRVPTSAKVAIPKYAHKANKQRVMIGKIDKNKSINNVKPTKKIITIESTRKPIRNVIIKKPPKNPVAGITEAPIINVNSNINKTNIEDSNINEISDEELDDIDDQDDNDDDDDCMIVENNNQNKLVSGKELRSAASKRYRDRLKKRHQALLNQTQELMFTNRRLMTENSHLKQLLTRHMETCPQIDNLRELGKELNIIVQEDNS